MMHDAVITKDDITKLGKDVVEGATKAHSDRTLRFYAGGNIDGGRVVTGVAFDCYDLVITSVFRYRGSVEVDEEPKAEPKPDVRGNAIQNDNDFGLRDNPDVKGPGPLYATLTVGGFPPLTFSLAAYTAHNDRDGGSITLTVSDNKAVYLPCRVGEYGELNISDDVRGTDISMHGHLELVTPISMGKNAEARFINIKRNDK